MRQRVAELEEEVLALRMRDARSASEPALLVGTKPVDDSLQVALSRVSDGKLLYALMPNDNVASPAPVAGCILPAALYGQVTHEPMLAPARQPQGVVSDALFEFPTPLGPRWRRVWIWPTIHQGEPCQLHVHVDAARLHIAEQRLATLTDTLPIGIGVTRQDGVILYANRAGAEQHGMPLDQMIGSRAQDLFESPAEREQVVRLIRTRGRVDGFEAWWRKPDGGRRRMSLTSQPITLDGRPCIMGTGLDITKAHETHERMIAITEAGPTAIIISRRSDGVVVYVNAPMCRMLGADEEELIGRPGPDFWADTSHRIRVMEAVESHGELRGEEVEVVATSGRRFWVSADIVALHLDGIPCVMGALIDIDEARRTRMALQQSLEDKALLLRELNHRVRNNLQVVISILNMQRIDAASPAAEAAFAECTARVRAMSAVHDALVKQPAVSSVSLGSLLRAAAPNLVRAYSGAHQGVSVSIEGDLTLSLQQAMPCGLLVNELLTNALKHAFSGGSGTVQIRLWGDRNHGHLIISDDGVGAPDRSRSGALGMKLIAALIKQLDGTLQQSESDAGGLQAVVAFPITTERQSWGPS